jgi:hypothetical protein
MNPRRTFGAALLFAFLLRALLAFAVPTGYQARSGGLQWYNDERAHANYVRFLADSGRFPVQTHSVQTGQAFARGDFEYYQPPLSYLVQVPAWKLGEAVRPGMGWLFCRLLQAALGTALVAGSWALARRIAPGSQGWVAWILALHPGLCYQSALCSNDPLFWMVAALFLLVVLDIGKGERLWPLAPLTAAALLTKSSAITLLALPVLALSPPIVDRLRPKRLAEVVGWLGLGLAAAFPWYLRNHHLYGSWMALEVGHGAPFPLRETLSSLRIPKGLVLFFSTSLWYPMDMAWCVRPLPRTLLALGSLAWISPLLLAGRRLSDRSAWIPWAALFLGGAAMIPYALTYRQSEARLLFHLLPAFCVLWGLAAGRKIRLFGIAAIVPSLLVWAHLGWLALDR